MQSLKDMNRVEVFSTELCMYSIVCIFRMKDCVRKNRFMDDAKEVLLHLLSLSSVFHFPFPLYYTGFLLLMYWITYFRVSS